VERGVRFINIYNEGWDAHSDVAGNVKKNTGVTDQATAALIKDLKQRGMLDDTLVVWGGEFGRTSMSEIRRPDDPNSIGRDHHPNGYSMWMAGGGIKGGQVYGETDDFAWHVARDPVSMHDFHATILHLFGLDHNKLSYRFQGLDFRLTGVNPAKVVKGLVA
jgi:uncharacterized protein (DUF1501 family)